MHYNSRGCRRTESVPSPRRQPFQQITRKTRSHVSRRDRREQSPERERPESEQDEPERESVAALKGILSRIAALLKPLGLTPEEAANLVQRMYGNVLEVDNRLVGESEERRKQVLRSYVERAEIRREDDDLVVEYPALALPETASEAAAPSAN